MPHDPSSKRAFDSESPTTPATSEAEALAEASERKLRSARSRIDPRTLKRGIIPSRVASDVDIEWMNLDEASRRFVAEVDGVRSASKIFHAIGITPDDGFALLERLLVAGVITLRH